MKRTTTSAAVAGLVLSSALTLFAPSSPAGAGVPVTILGRASVLPGAVESSAPGDATDATVSGNGRYVIFSSLARLVPADTDSVKDVYRKDLLSDSLVRVNPTMDGSSASSSSTAGAITPDGRYVAFWSWANDLVPGDTNGAADVFVRDLFEGTTERVSVSSSEQQGIGASPSDQDGTMDLSADGRYVAFSSTAINFGIDGDANSDIFVRDRTAGTTELISVNSAEQSGTGDSYRPSMSADGRFVAFQSGAADLVASDTNTVTDVFVRDRQMGGTTSRVSVHDNEGQSPTGGTQPWIDDSGTRIVFTSGAKLNAIDPNNSLDVYLRNTSTSTTTVGSVGTDGWAAGSSQDGTISGDGATIGYQSTSATALANANGWEHIYTRKITTTTRVTTSTAGTIATGTSSNPSLSTDGRVVAFDSKSTNLVVGDTGMKDVFFRRPVTFGPFNDVNTFVQRQLADFGGTGLDATAARIRAGASPHRVLVDLAHAPAFAGKRPQLVRLYVAYFKRLPDLGGMNYWLGKLDGGMKLDQVSAKFAASSEFKTKYGNTTNTQFVKLVYSNVFNRQPDASGLAYWVKKLDQGMSRGTVLTNFSESSEGKRRFSAHVNATLLGLGMLGTLPSGNLLVSMLDVSNGGSGTPEAAAQVLLESVEYAGGTN
jgi:hypothetical protein